MSEGRSTRRSTVVRTAVAVAGLAAVFGLYRAPLARSAMAPPIAEATVQRAPDEGLRPHSVSPATFGGEAQPAFELKPEQGPAVPAFELRPAGSEAVPTAAGPAVTVASWYGPGFNGHLTANGEVYDQEALTAAHRTLPFGTVLRVTNLNNGRQVEVRINDRGPFVDGRGIDLSHGAALALGMESQGVAPVAIEVIAPP